MRIVGCKKTGETKERLKNLIPSNLRKEDILLNIGYSGFEEESFKGVIFNKTEDIKNCVDKKMMFKIMKRNRVKCLGFLDLSKSLDKIKAVLFLVNNDLVLRKNQDIQILNFNDLKKGLFKKWDYATIKEEKLFEYRFIIFKNHIVRAMLKLNKNNDFVLKQENSKFIDIDINKISKRTRKNLLKAVKCLNIDLCGVDVLLNKKGKFKIIEVNSGMAMNSKSINSFYDILQYYLFLDNKLKIKYHI